MVTICKLILWLLTFGAAYFIKSTTEFFGLATMFFVLHAAIVGVLLVSLLILCAFGREVALKTYGRFLIRVLRFAVAILITSIFSFMATLLVNVDFYTAYMLLSLGQCMYNIDVVEERDFAKLKTKFKTKNTKKSQTVSKSQKVHPAPVAKPVTDKKVLQTEPIAQTIAEKKVQQDVIAEIEDFPIEDSTPPQETSKIPTLVIEDDFADTPIDADLDLQLCEQPKQLEPKPLADLPID